MTAAHVLNKDVLPHFEAHGARIDTVLSDNGGEFCGRPDRPPVRAIPATGRHRAPHGQGAQAAEQRLRERLHRTLLDEHFRIKGRQKWYESLEEMQADLDKYLRLYNHERTHQGRDMNGRTPNQAFLDGLPKPEKGKEKAATKAA